MKATEFEFRHRFWIIGAIFWFGFLLYRVDQLNMAQFLVNRSVGENSPHADSVARSLLLFGAFMVLLTALLRTWASAYLRIDVVQDPNLRAEKVLADGRIAMCAILSILEIFFWRSGWDCSPAGWDLLSSCWGCSFSVCG